MFGNTRCNHSNTVNLVCKKTPEYKWYLVKCEDCGKMNLQHIYEEKNRTYLTNKRVYPYKWFTEDKMPKLAKRLLVLYKIEKGEF